MNPGDDRFEDLYKRFLGRVYVFMVRFGFSPEKARDLAQDTFIRVYQNMGGYRGEAEWSYIEPAAKSVALNAIRAGATIKRKGEEVSLDEQMDIVDSGTSFEEALDRRATIAQLQKAIEELPPNLRICLKLSLRELTYKEVAGILNISVDAVKSRLRDARAKLRERLGAEIESLENDDDDQQS